MIEIDGRWIYDRLDELVDPAHTALLVIDVQNDFCAPGGTFERNGYSIEAYREAIPRMARLLAAARDVGALPIFIQNTTLADHRSDSPAQVRFRVRLAHDPHAPSLPYTQVGTWGHRFVDDLAPQGDEIVVPKYRSSAFVGTPLDLLLRSNGIETIVVTGATTEGCVESTARDGMFYDYYVVVVPDCVASDTPAQHEASMTLMQNRFDMFSSDDVAAAWTASRESAAA